MLVCLVTRIPSSHTCGQSEAVNSAQAEGNEVEGNDGRRDLVLFLALLREEALEVVLL